MSLRKLIEIISNSIESSSLQNDLSLSVKSLLINHAIKRLMATRPVGLLILTEEQKDLCEESLLKSVQISNSKDIDFFTIKYCGRRLPAEHHSSYIQRYSTISLEELV